MQKHCWGDFEGWWKKTITYGTAGSIPETVQTCVAQKASNCWKRDCRKLPEHTGRYSKPLTSHLYYGLQAKRGGGLGLQGMGHLMPTDLYLIGAMQRMGSTSRLCFWALWVKGNWELPTCRKIRFLHGQLYKWFVDMARRIGRARLPAYVSKMCSRPVTKIFSAAGVESTTARIDWKHPQPGKSEKLHSYDEVHIGMSGEDREFLISIVLQKKYCPGYERLGYNTLQLDGCTRHPLLRFFWLPGVSNIFCLSVSRFGTPDDLKHLIDQAPCQRYSRSDGIWYILML